MQLTTVYSPMPITFSHGEGIWLWDTEGKKYLDGLTGIAVCGLGHAHPAITQAISDQASKLLHTSNVYHVEWQEKLAAKLITMADMQQIYFANSGAEANEAAIKLARLYAHKRDVENPQIIVTDGAFHGRTLATLSASGSRKVQAGFEPLVSGFLRVPFNDVTAVQAIADAPNSVAAIFVEPVQGEGGVVVPDSDYLAKLREICDKNEWLLMLDEVQTGNGRVGALYDYMHHNVLPDVVTTAKGLGNGVPIGACMMRGPACDVFQPGNHGSTFGGNPMSCRVAHTVLDVIEKDNLCENAAKQGKYLLEQFQQHLGKLPNVVNVRGHGLMLGVELNKPCRDIMLVGLKHGITFSVTANSTIRVLPPLIITKDDADEIVKRLKLTIEEYAQA